LLHARAMMPQGPHGSTIGEGMPSPSTMQQF
jgi:hypothetical protein